MKSWGLVLTFTLCGLILGAPAAHAGTLRNPLVHWGRTPLYYSDQTVHTGYHDFPVADQARRWSRNPYVLLVAAPVCTVDLDPCVTITEVPSLPDDREAEFWGTITGQSTIVLTHGHDAFMDSIGQGDDFRASNVCHELGHYVLTGTEADHAAPGCMSQSVYPRPSRAARALIQPRPSAG